MHFLVHAHSLKDLRTITPLRIFLSRGKVTILVMRNLVRISHSCVSIGDRGMAARNRISVFTPRLSLLTEELNQMH